MYFCCSVMDSAGEFIELQGTGEEATFSETQLTEMLTLGKSGLQELLALQPGDVITTTKPAEGDVVLQVEGISKFAGRIGQFHGKRAIRISRRTKPDEGI